MNSPLDVIMPTPVPLPNEDVSISDYTKHAVLRKMSTNEYYSIIDIDNGKYMLDEAVGFDPGASLTVTAEELLDGYIVIPSSVVLHLFAPTVNRIFNYLWFLFDKDYVKRNYGLDIPESGIPKSVGYRMLISSKRDSSTGLNVSVYHLPLTEPNMTLDITLDSTVSAYINKDMDFSQPTVEATQEELQEDLSRLDNRHRGILVYYIMENLRPVLFVMGIHDTLDAICKAYHIGNTESSTPSNSERYIEQSEAFNLTPDHKAYKLGLEALESDMFKSSNLYELMDMLKRNEGLTVRIGVNCIDASGVACTLKWKQETVTSSDDPKYVPDFNYKSMIENITYLALIELHRDSINKGVPFHKHIANMYSSIPTLLKHRDLDELVDVIVYWITNMRPLEMLTNIAQTGSPDLV